ncbi:hypothetical protein LL946_06270 [Knoellia locipacati]|uniref:hypothetical protein n=1 Tax=Knoellia locipacati TaxID=882824 RepID=UPI00384A9372
MSTVRRGAIATFATLAAAASLGLAGGPAHSAPAELAALPDVNHERLVLAAQLDPSKPDRGLTAGAEDSVRTVKAALRAKGLLASTDTDGHFGRATMDAWRVWENRVHTTDNPWSTNGLPSLFELNELAPNRFTLSHKVDQGSWVTENGEAVNERTRAMFRKAEALSDSDMTITQGRGGAEASAGTHVGGGVIDIRVNDAPARTSARVAALREVGFAAWFRNWAGNEHIHAIAVGDPWVAYGSHRSLCQIHQFRFGGEGVSCSDSTAGTDRPLVWWEQYQRSL